MKLRSRFEKRSERRQPAIRVEAGGCPVCKSKQSRVYKTQGVVRYCCCDNCGETWSKTGPLANPLIDLALEALELLGGGDIVKTDKDAAEVVIIDVKAATDLANRFVAVLP